MAVLTSSINESLPTVAPVTGFLEFLPKVIAPLARIMAMTLFPCRPSVLADTREYFLELTALSGRFSFFSEVSPLL